MVKRDLPRPEDNNKPPASGGQMVWVPPGYEIAMESPEDNQSQNHHLWEHIWLLWRWRWLIILCFVACGGAALLMALKAVPIFEGTAKMRVEREGPGLMSFEDDFAAAAFSWDVNFVETQRQIIMNR